MGAGLKVVFALFPGVTQLDFTGPHEVFSRLPGATCTLASVDGGVIRASDGLTFGDVARLDSIPDCNLLCVPGGFGTIEALENGQFLHALRRLAATATYVTSICTGSLLLAAAGLLRSKRAACHWAWRELLGEFGVLPDPARIVRDGNVFTGGGVTAGIDLALAVTAEIAGPDYAQTIQLAMEYAPDPPFDCGRPELAREEVLRVARQRYESLGDLREQAVKRAARRMIEGLTTPGADASGRQCVADVPQSHLGKNDDV